MGGWVGPRASIDVLERKNIMNNIGCSILSAIRLTTFLLIPHFAHDKSVHHFKSLTQCGHQILYPHKYGICKWRFHFCQWFWEWSSQHLLDYPPTPILSFQVAENHYHSQDREMKPLPHQRSIVVLPFVKRYSISHNLAILWDSVSANKTLILLEKPVQSNSVITSSKEPN